MILYLNMETAKYFRENIFLQKMHLRVTLIINKFGLEMYGIYKVVLIISECEARKYGINCSKNCGNCHNQSKCHNVDGSCSGGCSAGYTGSLCTERKYSV